MRRILTWLAAAALILGLAAGEPAQAKVYKMTPEERAAALKEKKTQRKKSKKSGKAVPGQDQGGWVEMKPGEKIAKKNRQSKVDELAKAAEKKVKKTTKNKAAQKPEAAAKTDKAATKKKAADAQKAEKASARKLSPAEAKKAEKAEKAAAKKAEKAEKAAAIKAEQTEKAEKAAAKKSEQATGKKSGRVPATHGDRVVGRDFTGERRVPASSTEVRRPAPAATAPAPAPAPVQAPIPAPAPIPSAPQVRHEVQPGPVDAARPVNSDHQAGEGRF